MAGVEGRSALHGYVSDGELVRLEEALRFFLFGERIDYRFSIGF